MIDRTEDKWVILYTNWDRMDIYLHPDNLNSNWYITLTKKLLNYFQHKQLGIKYYIIHPWDNDEYKAEYHKTVSNWDYTYNLYFKEI